MSKKKTHYLIWDVRPNESDTEGYERVQCNNEQATVGSHSFQKVTCKQCIKITTKAKQETGK